MKRMKMLMFLFSGLLSSGAASAGGLVTVEVKSLIAREESRALVVCVDRVPVPAINSECPNNPDSPYCAAAGASEQIYLNMDSRMGKEIYSMLLTAHAASKKMQLFISNTNQCFIETANLLK